MFYVFDGIWLIIKILPLKLSMKIYTIKMETLSVPLILPGKSIFDGVKDLLS